MTGPWAIPDNPAKTSDDREAEVVVHDSVAKEADRDIVAGMYAALGQRPPEAGDSFSPDISQPTTHSYHQDNGRFKAAIDNWKRK